MDILNKLECLSLARFFNLVCLCVGLVPGERTKEREMIEVDQSGSNRNGLTVI